MPDAATIEIERYATAGAELVNGDHVLLTIEPPNTDAAYATVERSHEALMEVE